VVRDYMGDFFRHEELPTDPCRSASFAYHRQAGWEDYGLLKGLRVACPWGLSGRHFVQPTLLRLLSDIATNFRRMPGSPMAKLRRAASLLTVAVAQRAVAKKLVSRLDGRWNPHAAPPSRYPNQRAKGANGRG
jgi:hypothetical protein